MNLTEAMKQYPEIKAELEQRLARKEQAGRDKAFALAQQVAPYLTGGEPFLIDAGLRVISGETDIGIFEGIRRVMESEVQA